VPATGCRVACTTPQLMWLNEGFPVGTAQLRHFVAVAEELNMPRAAQKLGISPTMLDASITQLESEFGARLFDRTGDSLTLTEAGMALMPDARLALAGTGTSATAPGPKTGGKAKASKGKGRAPAVKGQPRPGKRRQSR
jgi:hypothetical protein